MHDRLRCNSTRLAASMLLLDCGGAPFNAMSAEATWGVIDGQQIGCVGCYILTVTVCRHTIQSLNCCFYMQFGFVV